MSTEYFTGGGVVNFLSAFNMVTLFAEGKGKIEAINQQLVPAFQINESFKFNDGFLSKPSGYSGQNIWSGVKFGFDCALDFITGVGGASILSSKLMMPSPKIDKMVVKETKDKEDDMMSAMRTQSMYMMPLMTVFIG